MTDPNALSALIGGYSGLLLGMLFIIVLNFNVGMYSVMDMFPLLMVMIISYIIIQVLGLGLKQTQPTPIQMLLQLILG